MNPGTFSYAGETVKRLGYGAMRITGEGVWGNPKDKDGALRVLRRAVELGVDFIDTADAYGPFVSEDLIHEALYPYGDVKIATKAGLLRTGPNVWIPCGRPDYLRQACEMSLRRLGQDSIDLFQLHRIDPTVNADEQFGLLRALRDEGKVQAVGLSNVNVAEVIAARAIVPISTVQTGAYQLKDVALALPTLVSRSGAGQVLEVPLSVNELLGLQSSAKTLAEIRDSLEL